MKIGFTGTQAGMTYPQKVRLRQALRKCSEFHHGDCIGSDAEAHDICREFEIVVVGHPPQNRRKRAHKKVDREVESLPYLERNRAIVRAVDVMIACPREFKDELRSGTWATIRYARRMKRRMIVIYPDGSGDLEN